jgi:hypothetical protein
MLFKYLSKTVVWLAYNLDVVLICVKLVCTCAYNSEVCVRVCSVRACVLERGVCVRVCLCARGCSLCCLLCSLRVVVVFVTNKEIHIVGLL